jgi:branched-chain amino acid transport system ATP-binding protein
MTTPQGTAAASVLQLRGATKTFGGLTAVDSLDLDIRKGQIFSIIGPNGAGKTTVFNLITGIYKPDSGAILLEGQSISGLTPDRVLRRGIARTFQNIRLFKSMTALENVLVGADANSKVGLFNALFKTPLHRRTEAESIEEAYRLLDFVGVGGRAGELAANLSYGDQRRLEIARAMATKPKLLCLDEPAAGFNPAEKQRLMELIRKVRDDGYTVLLIEHDMRLVMGVTDRIVVLEFGRKIAEGSPAEIRDNPAVVAAYLGVDEDDAS